MSFTNGGTPAGTTWRRDVAVAATGRGLSLLGDEVAVIALMLAVSQRSGGALLVALLLAAAAVPGVVLAPVTGLVVDRFPARRLLVTMSLAQALLCAVLVVVQASWALLVVVLLLNVAQAVVGPAWQALLPSVVPADRLPGALSTLQSVAAVAAMVGPALGGLLVGLGGTTLALGVDAASFAVLAAAAFVLHGDRVPQPGDDGRPWWKEATLGVRVVRSDRVLRTLFGLLTVFIVALGAVNVAEVFLVTEVLGASPLAYGLVGAAFAAGLLVGAVVGRRRRDDAGLARSVALACWVMAAGILALGLAPQVLVAGAASWLVGVGNGVLNIGVQQLVIRRAPAEALGRVFSTLQATANGGLLVALALGGALLAAVGTRQLVVAAAVVGIVATVAAARPLLAAGRTVPSPRGERAPETAVG